MDHVLSARALMGISLGFHIIFATIGIGLPLMLMLAEGVSLRTGDELYHQLARSWVRPAGLLFAIGAVSGTILSFELGLLWPRFMTLSGPLIGLPFSMEGFAFFIGRSFSPCTATANSGSPGGCSFFVPFRSALPLQPPPSLSLAPTPG